MMDLNIILWIGGMLFTLSIFAVKVGFGLGFSGMRWRGIVLTLLMYLLLFVLISLVSGQLMKILEPVLKRGPYLHAAIAVGMIVWGVYMIQGAGVNGQGSGHSLHSAWLIIPCPVCLTAISFSTWAALNVIKLPAPLVGLGLGCAFVVLSLIFLSLARVRQSANPRINLGLCMITIGCYFLASLFLPAKIEEARGIYQSFVVDEASRFVSLMSRDGSATFDSMGVLALFFAAVVIGYLRKIGR